MKKFYITLKGYEKLKKELEYLKSVERPKVVQAIAEARAHGDISENAEYDAAKEQQSFLETKIQQLETILAYANVIDTSKLSGDRVVFGAKVKLLDLYTDEELEYQIVGTQEADPKNGLISIESPIARALIGKKVGDFVEVKVPKGIREFEILDVSFE